MSDTLPLLLPEGDRMTGLTIGSLFSGMGGLDRAAEQVFGARTVWVSDIDKGASCAFLRGACEQFFELALAHLQHVVEAFGCHPIFAPQKVVWSAAKYPSAARNVPCSATVSPTSRLAIV